MSAALACIYKSSTSSSRDWSICFPFGGAPSQWHGSRIDWGPHTAARRRGELGSHCCPSILASRAAQPAQALRGSAAGACQAGGWRKARGPRVWGQTLNALLQLGLVADGLLLRLLLMRSWPEHRRPLRPVGGGPHVFWDQGRRAGHRLHQQRKREYRAGHCVDGVRERDVGPRSSDWDPSPGRGEQTCFLPSKSSMFHLCKVICTVMTADTQGSRNIQMTSTEYSSCTRSHFSCFLWMISMTCACGIMCTIFQVRKLRFR